MDLITFKKSIEENQIPEKCPILIQALWYDARGDWEKAHAIAQSNEGNLNFDIVHAYLHRKEGDKFNANYWYRRCNLPYPKNSLEQEWEALFDQLSTLDFTKN